MLAAYIQWNMYFPPTEILKIAYFLQPWARRAHRNPQNYIFLPKVGSIYPIKTFIPQMMASYIQYFWQFLTIFENFDNFAKLDFDDFFKIILPSKSSALNVVCPQSRLPSKSWAQCRCPQCRLPSMSHRDNNIYIILQYNNKKECKTLTITWH